MPEQPQTFDYNEAVADSINNPLNSLEDSTGFLEQIGATVGDAFVWFLIGCFFLFILFGIYYFVKRIFSK